MRYFDAYQGESKLLDTCCDVAEIGVTKEAQHCLGARLELGNSLLDAAAHLINGADSELPDPVA